MRSIKIFLAALIFSTLLIAGESEREAVEINLKNLSIEEFLKVSSKIFGKNILLTQRVAGEVDFISTEPLYKDEVTDILLTILETKGLTIVEEGTFLKVVRATDAAKENLPIVKGFSSKKTMVTEAIRIDSENVDVVVQKIRHFLSPAAKLVTMKESNIMLISEFPRNIETVKKVIDAIVDKDNKVVEFIDVKNTKVNTVFIHVNNIVKNLLNQKINSEKFFLSKNDTSSSIIVVGTKEQVELTKELVAKLDIKEDLESTRVEVINLENSEAKNVLVTLNAILPKLAGTKTETKGKDPKDQPKVTYENASITAEEEMNAIIVIATPEEIKNIKELIKSIDAPRQQVYIKAAIYEINKEKAEKIGLDYGIAFAGGDVGAGIYGLGASLAQKGSGGAAGLLAAGISAGAQSSFAIDVGLQLLETNGASESISEPSILSLNNKESSIYVGKTISFQTASNTPTNGGTVNTFKRQDVGLTLTVKPRLSMNDQVSIDISAQLENIVGALNGQPATSKSQVKTSAIVKDGDPVIIGGLVRTDETKSKEKVPFFSKIPFLGKLFQSNVQNYSKQNLIIVVTPYIVKKSEDLIKLRERLAKLEDIKQRYIKKVLEPISIDNEEK